MWLFLRKFLKVLPVLAVVCGFVPVSAYAQAAKDVQLLPGPRPELRSQLKEGTARNALLLSSLFGRLRLAEDADTAQILETSIWQVWLRSGSATIDLLMELAIKATGQQDHMKALKILDHIVELAPKFAEGWNKRATLLYFVGQYQASLDDIERVLILEPRHFGALSGRGMILQQLDDKKGALEAYRGALHIHPQLRGPKEAVKDLAQEVEGQGI